MSDDFFDKIGKAVGSQKAAEAAKADAADATREFVKGVIPHLVEIAQDYATKCRDRGIDAKVTHGDYSVTLTLRYKNGSTRDLVGGPDYERANRLSFEDHYPNDDGKRYKSMATEWFDETNWSDDKYEARLQKTIEDFVYYANRHGGL